MFGYGHMSSMPIYYMFWFLKPKVVKAMINFVNLINPEPTTKFTSKGFEQLWTKIIKKYNNQINVITNVNITNFNRNLSNNNSSNHNSNPKNLNPITINYNLTNEEKNNNNNNFIECDVVFISCSMDIALQSFLDATEEEREIFSKFTISTFFITT